MTDKYFLLSDDDRDILRGLIDREKRQVLVARNRPVVPLDVVQAPDVYLALAPTGGLPGMSEPFGTGTTDADAATYVPGSATCKLFKLAPTGVVSPVGASRFIYNVSTNKVQSGTLFLVERDKSGTWWAVPPSDSLSTVNFTVAGCAVAQNGTTYTVNAVHQVESPHGEQTTVTNVCRLFVDYDTGLEYSPSSDGILLGGREAMPTNWGMVTTADQSWSGNKSVVYPTTGTVEESGTLGNGFVKAYVGGAATSTIKPSVGPDVGNAKGNRVHDVDGFFGSPFATIHLGGQYTELIHGPQIISEESALVIRTDPLSDGVHYTTYFDLMAVGIVGTHSIRWVIEDAGAYWMFAGVREGSFYDKYGAEVKVYGGLVVSINPQGHGTGTGTGHGTGTGTHAGGTGTHSGGSCNVQRVGIGLKAQCGGTDPTTITFPGVTIPTGTLLVVNVAGNANLDPGLTVTFGGANLSLAIDSGVVPFPAIYYRNVSVGATGDVVVSFPGNVQMEVTAYYVTGLRFNTVSVTAVKHAVVTSASIDVGPVATPSDCWYAQFLFAMNRDDVYFGTNMNTGAKLNCVSVVSREGYTDGGGVSSIHPSISHDLVTSTTYTAIAAVFL